MDFKTFDELVERETKRMKDVMCGKSADYAAGGDKLFNFKLAAEVDGVTPIEALRGMWLKHRTSLRQGLDELMEGKPCRSEDWWIEKLTDDRNYSILLQALLMEKYFTKDTESEVVGKFTVRKAQDKSKGWYIILTETLKSGWVTFLHKDLELHSCTGWTGMEAYGCAPGYYGSKEHAKVHITAYEKQEKFVCPAGWEIRLYTPIYGKDDCGWLVGKGTTLYLYKDLTLHEKINWDNHEFGEAPGYWLTKEAAEKALAAYLAKGKS